jgi:hypothetical protein
MQETLLQQQLQLLKTTDLKGYSSYPPLPQNSAEILIVASSPPPLSACY